MHLFLILHKKVHISINNFIFKHFSARKCNIDYRRKLHSIKSERFEGVLLEALMKNLHLFISQFFGFGETLIQIQMKQTENPQRCFMLVLLQMAQWF